MQVILVGHDFGGVCISHAMEAFPSKIAKSVFVSASMLMNGQSTLDMFTKQVSVYPCLFSSIFICDDLHMHYWLRRLLTGEKTREKEKEKEQKEAETNCLCIRFKD